MTEGIPYLKDVTLVCADCTDKVHLSEWAIGRALQQSRFAAVKLLTHDTTRKWAVKIPKITSIEEYSRFIIRDLHRYVDTPFCMVMQWDGFPINGSAWKNYFLDWDYSGAPMQMNGAVGNGGMSLRSKRLLKATSQIAAQEFPHPEDAWISFKHRHELESLFGIRFAPVQIAKQFAFEGRSFNGSTWNGMGTKWEGQYSFHSYLTVLPPEMDRPNCLTHSGDMGDVIYSLAVIKALGGGVLFLSPDNKHPWPRHTRWTQSGGNIDWASSLASLCNTQDYIWATHYTQQTPPSTDFDLNKFREFYRMPRKELWDSLFQLHLKAFGISYPENEPWLHIEQVRKVPGRDIVINRTGRFNNPNFPWRELVQRFGQRMVFIGTAQEHADFAQFGTVPRADTKNLLEVGQYVAGSSLFIGNQSCPLAIAIGLGKRHIVEAWPKNANCRFKRNSQVHYLSGNLEIPEGWV